MGEWWGEKSPKLKRNTTTTEVTIRLGYFFPIFYSVYLLYICHMHRPMKYTHTHTHDILLCSLLFLLNNINKWFSKQVVFFCLCSPKASLRAYTRRGVSWDSVEGKEEGNRQPGAVAFSCL